MESIDFDLVSPFLYMFNQSVTADRKKRRAISKIYKTIGFSCCSSLVYYHPIISWLINTSVAFSWPNTKKEHSWCVFVLSRKKKEERHTKLLSCTQQLLHDKSNLYQRQSQVSLFFLYFGLAYFFFFFFFLLGFRPLFTKTKIVQRKKYSVVPSAWPSSTPPPPTISARSVPGDIAVTWLNEARSGRSSIVS